MSNGLSSLSSDEGVDLRAKVIGMYVLLIGANIAAWLWALSAFRDYPILLGTAMLAYTFGLRHAFDADHIAAFDNFTSIGGVVGTLVSALFLFAIAIANILVLISIYRTFRTVKSGGKFVEEDLDLMLANRGFLGRLFRRFFHLIERSWQMYPLGVLFGLGFDTAT